MRLATCWLRVVISPPAETSTNSGESTNSSPYWSRAFTASDQESSIFWNWATSVGAVEATGAVAATGVTAGPCAIAEAEKSTTGRQTAKRIIGGTNSQTPIINSWTLEQGHTRAAK